MDEFINALTKYDDELSKIILNKLKNNKPLNDYELFFLIQIYRFYKRKGKLL